MAREYSKTGSVVTPCVLSDEVLLAMGRLIRAFAEIEDIINLHMCQTGEISEGQAFILLGRTGISQKLNFAHVFANALGGPAKKVTDECFDNDAFREMLMCRNVVAHGVLLGITDRGHIAFRTSNYFEPDLTTNKVGLEVITFTPRSFAQFADMAELAIQQIEGPLKVKEPREARRAQALENHPKAQPTRPPSAKQQRQRKPPRVKRKPKA